MSIQSSHGIMIHWLLAVMKNISSRFSGNSETFVSEFLENLEGRFLTCLLIIVMELKEKYDTNDMVFLSQQGIVSTFS